MLLAAADARNLRNREIEPISDKGIAFIDLRPLPVARGHEQCRRCHGHGFWNLVLHFRGAGDHMRSRCTECNGSGNVPLPKEENKGKPFLTNAQYFAEMTPQRRDEMFALGRTDYSAGITRDQSSFTRAEREAYSRGRLFAQRDA